MKTIIPQQLKKSDEIRIIAPSRSLSMVSKQNIKIAIKKINDLGFKVSFSKNVNKKDVFDSSSIESRINDIHTAFKDKKIKAILTSIGGYNSNQLLNYIDFSLIKNNPKIFCGYSDITILLNTIYAKTGLITYSGPHFSTFAMQKGLNYTIEYFKKCLMKKSNFTIQPSDKWSDDSWYTNQNKRNFVKNPGYTIINHGKSNGTIIGGNLCTFNLLQGTQYMPSLKNSIIFIEDDDLIKDEFAQEFDRNIQSLIQQKKFNLVKAIAIGRFQKKTKMTMKKLRDIVNSKKELSNIPIIADIDFGHTTPQITFPIGGTAQIDTKSRNILKIIKH